MPPILPGQIFANLLDFKEALRQWAIEANWTPHILDSDSHRVRAGCRSGPDCPFRIRANYNAKRGDARVTTVDDVHNCESFRSTGPAHQNIKRAETGKLKFLIEAVPKLMNVTLETSIHEIIAVVEQKYGQKIPIRQAQKVKGNLVMRVKGPCRHCHRMGHTRRHCPQLRDSAPGPLDFSNSTAINFSRNGESEASYADGGMNDTFDHSGMNYDNEHAQQPHLYHGHPRPDSSTPYQNQTGNIDPGLNNGADHQYGTSPILPPRLLPTPMSPGQLASLQSIRPTYAPTTNMTPQRSTPHANEQTPHTSAFSPTSAAASSPAEVRTQATRLMQQATQMMQQAAQLNVEASRLLTSLG